MGIARTILNIHTSAFLRQDRFFCKVDMGGGMLFKIWERPGRWMEPEKLKRLISDIRQISHAGQDRAEIPEYGVLKGDEEDLKSRVITICYEKESGRPVGFAAQVFLEVPIGLSMIEVLHLGLVYVAKDYQKKSMVGLLYILPNILLLLKRGFRPLWISNVTQVPSVMGVVADYYEDVYPSPFRKVKQSLMQKSLSVGIMKDYRAAFGTGEEATFEQDKQIIRNSYTGGSDNLKKKFEDCPPYRDEKVNSYCKENLDYERGDDFLQIGRLSGKLIHNFFSKRVAGVSRTQWVLYLFVAGIFTTTLPVLRWLTRKSD
jgi:hypothetical protein